MLKMQVFDFSQAQRAAHEEEFADTVLKTRLGWTSFSEAAQATERNELRLKAREFQRGCWTHFRSAVRRIKQNTALVPPNRLALFESLIDEIATATMEPQQFDELITRFHTSFQHLGNWISWWTRPSIAAMIFPSRMKMSAELVEQLPRTSNPVETQHSLLHHGSGKNHDALKGLEMIHMHVEGLRRQYEGIASKYIIIQFIPHIILQLSEQMESIKLVHASEQRVELLLHPDL